MQFNLESVEKIKNVFPIFKKVSDEMDCFYLDLNEFVTPSPVDGLHYSKESHKTIAQILANFIKTNI